MQNPVISREEAKAMGFTHEGTIYGFPAWMQSLAGDFDEFDAQTKFTWINFMPVLCDIVFHALGDLAGWMGMDASFAVPFTVGEKL